MIGESSSKRTYIFQICVIVFAYCNLARTNENLTSKSWRKETCAEIIVKICGNQRNFFCVMNGNLYNDVMYVYTIGNEGNPKLDFLHTLADLNHLRISYIDRVLWVYLVLFFLAHSKILTHQSSHQPANHEATEWYVWRCHWKMEQNSALLLKQAEKNVCVLECVYEGMPPNGNFDNANTWCLNMIMFINFQPRDLRGVVFFLANSFWGSCKINY